MRLGNWIWPLAAVLLSGCAIHPVQRDVTGIKTSVLVDYIRCETRLAIVDKAVALLEGTGDAHLLAMAAKLRLGRNRPLQSYFGPADLPPDAAAFYQRYIDTGVAFDFTFDITEENRASLAADPLHLITRGTAGIGLLGTADYSRQNSRRFVMSETFRKILYNEKLDCAPEYRGENFVYPISGRIGMKEIVDTFIDLNEDAGLRPSENGSSRVFADTLTFTTTLTGSATPHIELAALGNSWGLASTSVTGFGQRLDKHALIVGLSMEPAASVVRVPRARLPLPGFLREGSALHKTSPSSSQEQRALEAVTQQRIDTFLDRFGTSLR